MYATNTLLVTDAYKIETKSSEGPRTSYRPHAHSQSYKLRVVHVTREGRRVPDFQQSAHEALGTGRLYPQVLISVRS